MNVNAMVETLSKLPAPNSSETAIADFLLNKLRGYRFQPLHVGNDDLITDRQIIETVLQAYAKMIQDAGISV